MTSIISAARSAIRSVTGTERSDDGFGGTLRRAPDWLDPRYDEGGEDADTPWWQTPFLEVPATERRRGPRGRRDADDDDDDHDDHDGHDGHDDDDRFYVGDEPLWPTLSHVVLMSFALRQMVRALERHDDGEKLGDSCVVNMTVAQLRQCAEDAVEKAVKEVGKFELKRVGPEPKTPDEDEFPNYVHVRHVPKAPAEATKAEGALECDLQHVDFIGDDLLDVLRRRKRWDRRAKKRLKMVTAVRTFFLFFAFCDFQPRFSTHATPTDETQVSYWRTGKPLKMIRDELVRSEQKAAIAAKKTGDPPPPTVFGTRDEVQALMPKVVSRAHASTLCMYPSVPRVYLPVSSHPNTDQTLTLTVQSPPKVNDKREEQKVPIEENLAGEVILLHPEEHEMRFLELMSHALLRFDVHLASTRYHVNMQIDYDEDNNIVGAADGRQFGCVDACLVS